MATTTKKATRMHNPAPPGEILRELCLEPMGVTITEAAAALGVSRKHVSAIVNGRTPVTPDRAMRLTAAATEPELWLSLRRSTTFTAVALIAPKAESRGEHPVLRGRSQEIR